MARSHNNNTIDQEAHCIANWIMGTEERNVDPFRVYPGYPTHSVQKTALSLLERRRVELKRQLAVGDTPAEWGNNPDTVHYKALEHLDQIGIDHGPQFFLNDSTTPISGTNVFENSQAFEIRGDYGYGGRGSFTIKIKNESGKGAPSGLTEPYIYDLDTKNGWEVETSEKDTKMKFTRIGNLRQYDDTLTISARNNIAPSRLRIHIINEPGGSSDDESGSES